MHPPKLQKTYCYCSECEQKWSEWNDNRPSNSPLTPYGQDAQKYLDWWAAFYCDEFNIKLDFTFKQIPDHPLEGEWRLIVVAKGLTIEDVFQKFKSKFDAWKWYDGSLDDGVPVNDRDPKNSSYAIWVRDTVEADEEFKSLSANTLQERGIKAITLLERLLLELNYFGETGEHLDIVNWTLCAGSRSADGGVPSVYWDDGLRVSWDNPSSSSGRLRARQAVS